ncbi:alpha/beta hydrolase family protein [Streptomyces sp. NPDC015220]|uniref:alpha/beta hydrolase family protein n=1 Tax=Streptomyces sp. NPDC015220 TaxID=3364947 RepID=UPI0036F9FBC3
MTKDMRKAPEKQTSWRMRRGLAASAALLLAALAAAPAATAVAAPASPSARTASSADPASAGHLSRRGQLLAVTPVAAHGRAEVVRYLAAVPMATDPVRYGVRAYRLTYRTVDPHGRPTTATGLLTLPEGGGRRLSLVSDTHGTMVDRAYAPSVAEDGRAQSYLFASAGHAVAAPDYLGLGEGPGTHPYMDTRSAVTASVDMLRAARTAARSLGRTLTGDLYVSGFSQGGQVAMALGRAIEEGADRHFRLRALAPVSGPYDLAGVEMPALTDGRVNDTSGVFYMAYFLVAQNRLHPIYKNPAEVFRAPYASRVESLFDGRHEDEDVVARLAPTVRRLVTDDFYRQLTRPKGGLLEALRANDDVCDWKPAAPVRLYAGNGDTDVPIGNARDCARALAGHGVAAPVVDQGHVDHKGSALASLPKIARWFDSVGAARGN